MFFTAVFALNGAAISIATELEWSPDVVSGTLDNGFTYYILHHNKPKNRIFADLLVRAGSVNEREDQRGIAHFIEHMAFNGSNNFPPGELIKYFESIGVDFGPDVNAYTSIDRTVYSLEIPTEKEEYVEKGLLAFGDYAGGLLFLPEEVDKEKGIILEELRLGRDVSTRVFEQEIEITLKNTLYPERLPIGVEETVSSFTSEDLKEFYSHWYRPDLMSLVVVGDYDPYELEKEIKEVFGKLPVPEGEKPDLTVPFAPHEEIYEGLITDKELEETSVYISYLRDPEKTKTIEDYKRDLCDTIIFEMLNRRFTEEEYKAETPLIYSGGYISNWLPAMIEAGLWASVKPGKALEGLEVVMAYGEGFRNYGFNKVEREEVEAELLEFFRKSAEEEDTHESYVYLNMIEDAVTKGNVYIPLRENYEMAKELIPSITDEEINARINYLFDPLNMAVIVEAPEEAAGEIKEEEILPIVEKVMTEGGISYELEALEYSYDYSSLLPGEIVSREDYEELNLTVLELSNGLKVLLKPTDFDKDTVIVNYSGLGGKLLQKPENPGMYAVSSVAWTNGGTKDLKQFEVDRLLNSKNISIGAGGSTLYWLYGSSSKAEFETLCQWLWQYLERPGYSDEGIDYAIKTAQESIRSYSQYLEGAMYKAEDRILLPNNPLSVYATEEEVENYRNPEELKKFQELSFIPGNGELTILGAFELEEGIELACKYFGSLPADGKPEIPAAYLKAEFPSGNTERIIYKGIEEKCLGTVIFPACTYDDPNKPAVDILADILDTRLNDTVREEKSLAYSIWAMQSSPLSIKNYGRFYIEFGCDPEKIEEVLEAVTVEINDIKENGITKKELETAKKIILSDYEEAKETNDYWLGELEGITIFDYPAEDLLKFEERYNAVTAEEVEEAARAYLNEKNKVVLMGFPEEEKGE